MRRLLTLAARLAGEIRASGWRVAAGKSVRHVVGRAGGAFRDQTDVLERQLQQAREEAAQLRDAFETLRTSTAADQLEWRAYGSQVEELQRRLDAQTEALRATLATRSEAIAWVSTQESLALATTQVRRKHARRPPDSPRVLYACEFFPHLTETYVTTEIATLRRLGAKIEVYTEHDGPVPGVCDVPVHRGELRDAIARFDPDIVHVHYLHRAFHVGPVAAASGRPVTVRAHSFEFTPERLAALATRDEIRAVFQFPHLIPPDALSAGTKIHPMTCCFDPELHYPGEHFDPRVVVRSGTANPHKDLPLFIRVAAKCPNHRFVLSACWSIGYPDHLEELRALNRSLGSPVEIRVNEPHDRVIALTRQAGIHLHTFRMTEPYGMPVSIVEAMAAGCYPISRHNPASLAFLAGAGATYETEDQAAALIRATEAWSAAEWRAARLRAIERWPARAADSRSRPSPHETRRRHRRARLSRHEVDREAGRGAATGDSRNRSRRRIEA